MEICRHLRAISLETTTLLLAFFLRSPGALGANDQLRQMAENYASTISALDADLNMLREMDNRCLSQDVVYDPANLSSHPKSLARMFKGADMAKMDAAVQQLGREIVHGKEKLDQTVPRIKSARDSLEELTAKNSLQVTNVDACQGGDAAQAKVLSTAQAQVNKAESSLSLGSGNGSRKLPKISTTIETFKSAVKSRASQGDFAELIKACTGPSYTKVFGILQNGIAKLSRLQTYAESMEKSVLDMKDSLTAQAASLNKQTGCKSTAQGAATEKPNPQEKSTITGGSPEATAATSAAARAPSAVDAPLPPEKPVSISAYQRIQSQSSAFTSAPGDVPSATDLSQCYADPCSRSQVRAYQAAINQYIAANNLPITPIATDGIAGTQTANAWRAVMSANNSVPQTGRNYLAWGAQEKTGPSSAVYYTFPPAKITSPSQLANFFQ